jgi:hypothetical protein
MQVPRAQGAITPANVTLLDLGLRPIDLVAEW